MIFSIINHDYKYELEKICRLFMPFEKFEFCNEEKNEDGITTKVEKFQDYAELMIKIKIGDTCKKLTERIDISDDFNAAGEHALAVMLYKSLCEITDYVPLWGILTGIRPARLLSRLYKKYGEEEGMKYFKNKMLVSEEKADLCARCLAYEQKIIERSAANSFSLYISIPFCPSRCNYCSFVSHSIEKAGDLMDEYVELLCREIECTGEISRACGLQLQTVYMGGGTPTTLSHIQLKMIFDKIQESFDMSGVEEFTVEAGRPDTITAEKLLEIKNAGATRISINPQTMNDELLCSIGRRHTVQQTIDAFKLARSMGFKNINMDLIAGLYGDTVESFKSTVDAVLELDPECITVHALSMKRASNLTKANAFFELDEGIKASQMLQIASEKLNAAGVLPYYMYRQGKTVGNLENVGYAKDGFCGLYNVYIMDETHTILACGASAVTKLKQPDGERIERIFNYKYPYEYIKDFEVLINRKNRVGEFYELYGVGNK